MILYHGSHVSKIETLRPFASNHQKPYVYMTHSPILATVYAHNPMQRPNGFFTYWWGKDGTLHYDEYYENQMEDIYAGQQGYVYTCEGNFTQIEKMPWVYISEETVRVKSCKEIPDIYTQLLAFEQKGQLRVRRWKDASERQREIWENVVRRSLDSTDRSTSAGAEYVAFIKEHFPNIQ